MIDFMSLDQIALIVELGNIYKEKNEDWIYGDLEIFVKENYESALMYWYKNYHDCDVVIKDWYKNNFEVIKNDRK